MNPLAVTLIAITLPAAPPTDLNRMVWVIGAIETPSGNPRARGRDGEHGLYQFKPETWAQTTCLPFAYADDPRYAGPVARKRLLDIKDELAKQGIEPSPYVLAMAWKAGVDAVILRKWQPDQVRDYAQRSENLYLSR